MSNKKYNIIIVISEFNKTITDGLLNGAKQAFDDNNGKDLTIIKVPGAFEIPGMVKQILDNKNPDLIITLGVLIKGETTHFEYISESVAQSISKLTISSNVPIIFGVITALNYMQASERALVSKKNKGAEVMKTGLKMLELYDQYKK